MSDSSTIDEIGQWALSAGASTQCVLTRWIRAITVVDRGRVITIVVKREGSRWWTIIADSPFGLPSANVRVSHQVWHAEATVKRRFRSWLSWRDPVASEEPRRLPHNVAFALERLDYIVHPIVPGALYGIKRNPLLVGANLERLRETNWTGTVIDVLADSATAVTSHGGGIEVKRLWLKPICTVGCNSAF